MDTLSTQDSELRARAARFVDEILIPLEVKAELAGGPLPPEDQAMIRAAALEAGMQGGEV